MEPPLSLPDRMYLLAYHLEKDKMTAATQLGCVLRAAALADLRLRGRLDDDAGRPAAVDAAPLGDPVLDEVLSQVAESKPRSWQRWIRRDERRIVRAVRDQLEKDRWIKVEHRPLLPDRVTLRERRAVKRYAARVQGLLGRPAGHADPRDTAALALAAAGDLKTVVDRSRRRRYKDRIRELTADPIPHALRKAVQSKRGSYAGA